MSGEFKIPPAQNPQSNQARLIIQAFSLNVLREKFTNLPEKPETNTPPELYKSKLNTPVFSDLDITGASYTKNGQNFNFDSLKIETVLFSITQRKNIVVTPIQGRDGTIKEYISDGDYDINIKGVLSAPNNTFPLDDFRKLVKAVKAPVAIKVNSWYLKELGIYNIVVTEFEFTQEPGRYSSQAFQIMAISDLPVELKIK